MQRIGIDGVSELEERSWGVIERLRENFFAPSGRKSLQVKFSIGEAASMVGRTEATIRNYQKDGRLPKPADTSKRKVYTLEDINRMRGLFGTLPWRDASDEPVVLAIQNFKGGVGKSTLTVHFAQFLALRGYRVCVFDCDPQASATSLFGINSASELDDSETLLDFLGGDRQDVGYAVRETYWPQLSIVPSKLNLYDIEYMIAAQLPNGGSEPLNRLRAGIEQIKGDFDVILIDPPPALGMISLNVLRAANALVVPTRPASIDFGSTANFFTMLKNTLSVMERFGDEDFKTAFKFLKVMANDVDESKSAHRGIVNMMSDLYGTNMLNSTMKTSAEIDNASGRYMSVYELPGPITSREVHLRAKAYFNAVFSEILLIIRQTWPSNTGALRDEGVI